MYNKRQVKYFCWQQLGLTLLHRSLSSDKKLVDLFINEFGSRLTRQQLSDAFNVGYFFFSKVHNLSIKNFDDLEKLGIILEVEGEVNE